MKIGDKIKLNENLLKEKNENLQRELRNKLNRTGNIIRSIEPCANACKGCPGLVNGGCWSYGRDYMLIVDSNEFIGEYSF